MRTDERQCVENAAEFSGWSNERLEVLFRAPTIGNRTIRKPHEDQAIGGANAADRKALFEHDLIREALLRIIPLANHVRK
jgi:hypothetical protein